MLTEELHVHNYPFPDAYWNKEKKFVLPEKKAEASSE